jgi:hypothetical protein
VSVAVIVAVGVNTQGQREVLGNVPTRGVTQPVRAVDLHPALGHYPLYLGGAPGVGVGFPEIDMGLGVLRFAEPVKAAGMAHDG